jgi:hypothetical protein
LDLSDDPYWSLLKGPDNFPCDDSSPVSPPLIERTLENSIPNGYFRRFIGLLLIWIVSAETSLETYKPLPQKYPDLALLILEVRHGNKAEMRWECEDDKGEWTRLRRLMWCEWTSRNDTGSRLVGIKCWRGE